MKLLDRLFSAIKVQTHLSFFTTQFDVNFWRATHHTVPLDIVIDGATHELPFLKGHPVEKHLLLPGSDDLLISVKRVDFQNCIIEDRRVVSSPRVRCQVSEGPLIVIERVKLVIEE